jgi:hypothetical protein
MRFFSSAPRKPETDALRLMPFVDEALLEGNRTCQGEVKRLADLINIPISVRGLGLFKARLISGLYIAYAFANVWMEKDEQAVMNFVNAVSGKALDPFIRNAEYPKLDVRQAKAIIPGLVDLCFAAIRDELLNAKTSMSTSNGSKDLVEMQLQVIDESINTSERRFPADFAVVTVARNSVTRQLHRCVRCIRLLRYRFRFA